LAALILILDSTLISNHKKSSNAIFCYFQR
jgi:hypothetical protein